jgi:hypothetical protein
MIHHQQTQVWNLLREFKEVWSSQYWSSSVLDLVGRFARARHTR